MRIFELDAIPQSDWNRVGGKARGLCALARCGLNVPAGFVILELQSDTDVQAAADHYEQAELGCVAVRSSATAEDGADFSGAGQYSTFLNVEGKTAVKRAILDCIRSLDNETAQSYTAFFGAAKSAQMCVVVQQMVKADASGVCFTQSPDGQPGMLIEAVEGLGEKLVSGIAAAQSFHLDADTPFVPDCEFLDNAIIQQIGADALKAERAFGMPLDMEWAVGGGTLYWLQARPITVTEEIDAFELDNKSVGETDILTTCNVGEMLPGAVTPLSIFTSVSGIDYGMRKMIKRSGGAKKIDDIPRGTCVTNFGGHLFINISSLYRIGDSVLGATREGVELSLCGRLLEGLPKPPLPKISTLRQLNNGRRYFSILMRSLTACRKLDNLAKKLHIPEMPTSAQQLDEIEKKLYYNDEAFWLHYITSAQSGSMSSALLLILMQDGMGTEEAMAKIAGVLEDIDGIESVDILRSLRTLARALIEEKSDIGELSVQELAACLKTCGDKSRAALDTFLKRHGHRAIREAELRSPSWHADEESLCSYLKTVIASGAEEKPKARTVDANIAAMLEGRKGLMRFLVNYIIRQARKGVVRREYTKSRCIKVLDKFKTAYRHLAGLMVKEKLLPEEDLIFFLTPEEQRALSSGMQPGLVKRAMARRRILEEQKAFKFDEVCVGPPRPLKPVQKCSDGLTLLTGSSLSRGKATGVARVVRSVEEAKQLQNGEIMVTAFTDIGWSPYYCMLGGLITEVGSALSHGAVVAREYALPLVSNIPFATQVIKTGDLLSIDGAAGEVAIIG